MSYRSSLVSTFWIGLVFVLVAPGLAQQDVEKKEKVSAPRALRISDANDWRRVNQFLLSPDGKWAAHIVMPNEGDGELIFERRDNEAEKKEDQGESEKDAEKETGKNRQKRNKFDFVVGPGSGQVRFSHDSAFVAWIESPKDKASKAARKSGKPVRNKAMLLNLDSGETTTFENAQRISFSGENPKCFAVQKTKPKGRPGDDKGWDGTDLLIHDLATGAQINLGNVKSFSFNKAGNLLALIIDAEGMAGNGLQLFHVADARLVSLENEKATWRSLSWTREGDALTALKALKDDRFKTPHYHLVAIANVGEADQKNFTLDPATDPAIPDAMTISPDRRPSWNDQRTMIFFGIHPHETKDEDPGKKEKGSDGEKAAASDGESADRSKSSGSGNAKEEQADLVIWHWQDSRLQSMQQKQESRDKDRFDLCAHRVEDATTFRLGDEEIPNVSVKRPWKFAVGTDNRKYERMGNLDGRRFQDVYAIDLGTGKRKLLLEKARYVFDVSPNGVDLLFYKDDGHFYIYNMDRGTTTNITEKVATSFINTDDDHNVTNPPRRPVGWTMQGDHVLLSDGWDIWSVPVEGGPGENMTVNGKAEQIRYTRPLQFDPEVDGIDFSGPVYLSAYGEWTKQAGYGRINSGKPGVEILAWEDASFSRLSRLEDHEIYYWSRSTRQESGAWFAGGPELKGDRKMTDSNPQQKNFNWSSGVKLVEYKDSHGNRLQGALHLPANYIEGKKYPTIVYMYEKLSQTANRYDSPRVGGFSASIYTSNGYAVFNPDIVFQVNDPGLSSKDCILAGLDAAVATGIVDPQRVGIHGHSWGGYQTAFLITQTDRFRAAVAGAPLTNLISMYSSIYWNSGSANQPIFESRQGRFTGGFLENLEAYARNSPVHHAENVTTPLLLLHNDQDGAVDWNQGIEYFNTLRRLGKPIVMLQYKGENHGLRKPANRKDYSHRMLEFFNHHLKEAEAPKWWSEGIRHLDMKDHIKDYRTQKTESAK